MLIVDLLGRGPVLTQEELAAALSDAGEPVTQATVSRDLAAVGAVRTRDGYRLAGGGAAGEGEREAEELGGVVRRHVMSAAAAHAMVVVRTAPGHAQMVASAFDRWPPDGVAGSVAGDDTIFLATQSPAGARALAERLRASMRGGVA